MKSWHKNNVEKFKDEMGTVFTKGPFTDENGNTYDWKLVDDLGEDYCTTEQMESWDVELDEILVADMKTDSDNE